MGADELFGSRLADIECGAFQAAHNSLKAIFSATGASFSPAAAVPGMAQKTIVEATQMAGKTIRRTDMKGSLWRDVVEEGPGLPANLLIRANGLV